MRLMSADLSGSDLRGASLRKTILKTRFHLTLDMDFEGVVRGCAARR